MAYSEEDLQRYRNLSKLINNELGKQLKNKEHRHLINFNNRSFRNDIFDESYEKKLPRELRYKWTRANFDAFPEAKYRFKIKALPVLTSDDKRYLEVGRNEIQLHLYGHFAAIEPTTYHREFDVSNRVSSRVVIGHEVPKSVIYFIKDYSSDQYSEEWNTELGEYKPVSHTEAIANALWSGNHKEIADITGKLTSAALSSAKAAMAVKKLTMKFGI